MTTNRPQFLNSEAEAMALELYGLTAVVRTLPGERDQNFHLKTDTGEEFVLKISSQTESAEILGMQNQAMAHVNRHFQISEVSKTSEVLPCPEVVTAVSGKIIESANKDGRIYPVRLITYLPGRLYAHVQPQDAHLQRRYGRFLGLLDRSLAAFEHPAAHRYLKWDLAQAGFITDYTQCIGEEDGRHLVQQFLTEFETRSKPQLAYLRQQIIHCDANDYNVIVGGGTDQYRCKDDQS